LISRFDEKSYIDHTNYAKITALKLATYLDYVYAVKAIVDAGSDLEHVNSNSREMYYAMTVLDITRLSLEDLSHENLGESFIAAHKDRVRQIIDFLHSKDARWRVS